LAVLYGCNSIAYTYSEATTFFEYMVDTSVAAHKAGIKNIWVTNGYMSQKALNRLCDVIDAANIDLKSFSESIYMNLNGGHLAPVLESLKTVHQRGVWLEITNLMIPTYNDNMEMVKKMCTWILENLGPDYPLHFSRFFPQYKLQRLPPTPAEVLIEARELAMQVGLHHVYIGNLPGVAENTICPACKKEVFQRRGYKILASHLDGEKCKFCGTSIGGRWE
jgi:pyruvate formate lyase activating enzyme